MTHTTDEKLRAYLDGELSLAAAATTANHLSICADCSATAAELRQTAEVFAGAMARMDAIEPARWQASADESVGSFVAGAAPRDDAAADALLRVLPSSVGRPDPAPASVRSARSAPAPEGDARTVPVPRASRSAPALWRWAAVVALMVAVGGSAAIATGLLRDGTAQPPAAATEAAGTNAGVPTGGGIFARPVDGSVEVVLRRAPAGSRVLVSMTDDDMALVEVEGAPAPHFTPADANGRVVVDMGNDAGVIRVSIPRGLRSGTVVWQDRIVVQVSDGRVTPDGAGTDGVVLRADQ